MKATLTSLCMSIAVLGWQDSDVYWVKKDQAFGNLFPSSACEWMGVSCLGGTCGPVVKIRNVYSRRPSIIYVG
ncbi:hypothetical protein M514_19656 [Trichuris suis]|uniref:Leucine-rich repeat-containing N-terminal plant-type domain-containing protein n=1 Tax=Trichuris suis TaxID=68888 RepID=A0A085NFC8_9BILA|nr:hypothetical protein M514_19656 [Trichuris suis]